LVSLSLKRGFSPIIIVAFWTNKIKLDSMLTLYSNIRIQLPKKTGHKEFLSLKLSNPTEKHNLGFHSLVILFWSLHTYNAIGVSLPATLCDFIIRILKCAGISGYYGIWATFLHWNALQIVTEAFVNTLITIFKLVS